MPVFVLFNPVSTDKQSAALKEKDAVQSFMLIYRQTENCQPHCCGEISCFSLVRIRQRLLQFVSDPHHLGFLIYLIAFEYLYKVIIQRNITLECPVCMPYKLFYCHIELVCEAAVADKHAFPFTSTFL